MQHQWNTIIWDIHILAENMLLYHHVEANWTAASLRHRMSSVKAQSHWSIIHNAAILASKTRVTFNILKSYSLIKSHSAPLVKIECHCLLLILFFLWLFSSTKNRKSKENQQEEKSDTQEKKKKKTREKVNVFATTPVSRRRHTNGIAVHGGDARTRIRFAHHRRWRKKRPTKSRPCPKNQRRRRRRSKRHDSWRSKRRRRRRRVDGDGWKIFAFFILNWPAPVSTTTTTHKFKHRPHWRMQSGAIFPLSPC